MKNAQVHRFGDYAAISLPGKGETKYLTACEAKALAKALNACARDMAAHPRFSESQFPTTGIELPNAGDRHAK